MNVEMILQTSAIKVNSMTKGLQFWSYFIYFSFGR